MKEDDAIKKVIEYEKSQGRNPVDVHKKRLGYDIKSSGRLIEVKKRDFPKRRFIFLTQKEFETFLRNKDAYLYIVTNEGKIKEIEREKVLKAAKPEYKWRISLRKEIVGE